MAFDSGFLKYDVRLDFEEFLLSIQGVYDDSEEIWEPANGYEFSFFNVNVVDSFYINIFSDEVSPSYVEKQASQWLANNNLPSITKLVQVQNNLYKLYVGC